MARLLTGIQSSGIPHLGNILGAIMPAIELSKNSNDDSFYFIADLHSLTTIKDADLRKQNVYSVAASWLAFDLDLSKTTFYRQSDIPQVCEFTWYLSCFSPFPMLANAHSFKDKSDKLSDVNAGLFTYPVLMAADILMYDANYVPVGKDQVQHLEITRDIAELINRKYGEILVVPEVKVDEQVMIVPGIDGQKMSKSYNNFINIYLPDKELLKVVKSIVTDSTPMEAPKNPDTCNVYKIYKLMASPEQNAEIREKYQKGGFGYGHAKQALFELIVEKFGEQREKYHQFMANPELIDEKLSIGASRAKSVADGVLGRLRDKLGF